jgi:hypothetical protein
MYVQMLKRVKVPKQLPCLSTLLWQAPRFPCPEEQQQTTCIFSLLSAGAQTVNQLSSRLFLGLPATGDAPGAFQQPEQQQQQQYQITNSLCSKHDGAPADCIVCAGSSTAGR